jgi:hypothetical protein
MTIINCMINEINFAKPHSWPRPQAKAYFLKFEEKNITVSLALSGAIDSQYIVFAHVNLLHRMSLEDVIPKICLDNLTTDCCYGFF